MRHGVSGQKVQSRATGDIASRDWRQVVRRRETGDGKYRDLRLWSRKTGDSVQGSSSIGDRIQETWSTGLADGPEHIVRGVSASCH